MQSGEVGDAVSSKSELLDSLRVYLNNKNRLQPIIGLSSIVECVTVGGHKRDTLYLCEVCMCRLGKADMRNHIMGSLHRYSYIKARHPHLVSQWKESSDLSKLAWPLMEMAKTIEGKEGAGDIQLIEVEEDLYQKMSTQSENDAVTLIRRWQEQDGPESHSETTSVQSQRLVLLPHNPWRWPEKSLKAENSNSFIDGYTGTEPVIGLYRVVECRSKDGHTHVFLCHCCRVKTNKKDIIDHLTSSSHLINYLMETRPDEVQEIKADTNDNSEFLQSLARNVEQEEGRGELKVVNIPESFCIPLTGKSYHWCVKMLRNGWTHTSTQTNNTTVRGPSTNKASVESMSEKRAAGLSKRPKRKTVKQKKRKGTNTVFKVSLPLTKGSVLLERMSFSKGRRTHSSASDFVPSPNSLTELDSDAGSLGVNCAEHTLASTNLQLQQGLGRSDADVGQYVEQERNSTATLYQMDNRYFDQFEDKTGTQNQKDYQRTYYGQHGFQERSCQNSRVYLINEGKQTPNEWLPPAVSPTQNWSTYSSSCSHEGGYPEQWYGSASQNNVGTREGQDEMRSDGIHGYYQQQPKNQYVPPDHSQPTGSGTHHSLSGEFTSHLNADTMNMYPHSGYFYPHSGSMAPESRAPFPETEQRFPQTHMGPTNTQIQTTPQYYMTQATAYQTIQIGHVAVSGPSYSNGSWTSMDPYYRDTGLMVSGTVSSESSFAYPSFNSTQIPTTHGYYSST